MKTSIFIPEEQLISKAVDVLIQTLGPVEASRFLTLPQHKRIDSVERHQRWQTTLEKDDFFSYVFKK